MLHATCAMLRAPCSALRAPHVTSNVYIMIMIEPTLGGITQTVYFKSQFKFQK